MGPDALARLIDAHASALVLYARQWCASPEDVVQEAFVKLAGRGAPPDPVLPWLYRVVRNGSVSARRAEARRRRHEAEAAARQPSWFFPAEGTGLDAARAAEALQGLPLEQREVLVARLWGGLTFDQIAVLAGLSSSAAHRLYHAGLAALRERLRVPCPDSTTTPN
jgi:RNA polymerase sigma-70 factor (ECF subfamily)